MARREQTDTDSANSQRLGPPNGRGPGAADAPVDARTPLRPNASQVGGGSAAGNDSDDEHNVSSVHHRNDDESLHTVDTPHEYMVNAMTVWLARMALGVLATGAFLNHRYPATSAEVTNDINNKFWHHDLKIPSHGVAGIMLLASVVLAWTTAFIATKRAKTDFGALPTNSGAGEKDDARLALIPKLDAIGWHAIAFNRQTLVIFNLAAWLTMTAAGSAYSVNPLNNTASWFVNQENILLFSALVTVVGAHLNVSMKAFQGVANATEKLFDRAFGRCFRSSSPLLGHGHDQGGASMQTPAGYRSMSNQGL